jgi:hypothetical protein
MSILDNFESKWAAWVLLLRLTPPRTDITPALPLPLLFACASYTYKHFVYLSLTLAHCLFINSTVHFVSVLYTIIRRSRLTYRVYADQDYLHHVALSSSW